MEAGILGVPVLSPSLVRDLRGVWRVRPVRRPALGIGRGGPGALPPDVRAALFELGLDAARPDRAGLVPDRRHDQPDLLRDRGGAKPLRHRLGRRGAGARASRSRSSSSSPRWSPPASRCASGWCAHECGRGTQGRGAPGPLRRGRARRVLAAHAQRPSQAGALPARALSSRSSSIWLSRAASRASRTCPRSTTTTTTSFQFTFVLLQSAAFGGVFIGFSIGADFDSGFTRRLFLAAGDRSAILHPAGHQAGNDGLGHRLL